MMTLMTPAHAPSRARTNSGTAKVRPAGTRKRARAGLRRSRELWRGPLHYADHHGDFIVVIDADLGMGVIWGTEGAQECDVLLELGQGRAVSKGMLDLACISVFGAHGHHLRGIERVHERGAPDPRARCKAIAAGTSCTPRRPIGRAESPGKRDVLEAVPQFDVSVGCMTPRSPLWNQPPRNASVVASGSRW